MPKVTILSVGKWVGLEQCLALSKNNMKAHLPETSLCFGDRHIR
ncbi:predicted protein [Botrytis cinerea T4]|uniref:Uncharacterized protein n=1 Tax=Botryotinia fuckeliana (strain T4) TaxID=999810 RepID=G2Y1T4_BOTF4|nr:predicted protein [Botrytis cinerea T4]